MSNIQQQPSFLRITVDTNIAPKSIHTLLNTGMLFKGQVVEFVYTGRQNIAAIRTQFIEYDLFGELLFDKHITHVTGVYKYQPHVVNTSGVPRSKLTQRLFGHWSRGRNYYKKIIIKLYWSVYNTYTEDRYKEYLSPSQRGKMRQAAILIQEVLDEWRDEHRAAKKDAFPDM